VKRSVRVLVRTDWGDEHHKTGVSYDAHTSNTTIEDGIGSTSPAGIYREQVIGVAEIDTHVAIGRVESFKELVQKLDNPGHKIRWFKDRLNEDEQDIVPSAGTGDDDE